MTTNGRTATTNKEKADLFADRLAQVFNETQEESSSFDSEFKKKIEELNLEDSYKNKSKTIKPFVIQDLNRAVKKTNAKIRGSGWVVDLNN